MGNMFPIVSYVNFDVPDDWEYRGEGNSHLVLTLPKQKKVLSIRKISRPRSLMGLIISFLVELLTYYFERFSCKDLNELDFYMRVVRPLLGERYVSNAIPVFISRQQVRVLEKRLEIYRPDFRKHKMLKAGRAVLFMDFTYLPIDYFPFGSTSDTFAIEIKPKQGWLPLSERSLPKCIYCLHQYKKWGDHKINKISSYCPRDLFSGNEDLMTKAIAGLIECPQNNFRIFKNGRLHYSDSSEREISQKILQDIFSNYTQSTSDLQLEFCNLITKCLLCNLQDKNEGCSEQLFCKWDDIILNNDKRYNLPKGCVLEKILSAQMLDAEGTEYYRKLLQLNKNRREYGYVKEVLMRIEGYKGACPKCIIMKISGSEPNKQLDDLAFSPYLISAVAKDCSLMITLKRITREERSYLPMKHLIDTKYGTFIINIGIFDLYPKPLSTIRKHGKRNKDILHDYKKLT